MSTLAKGIFAVIAASVLWGLIGLFYSFLSHIPPLEVLAHRTIWSMVFFGAVLLAQRRIGAVRDALACRRTVSLIGLAALMIAINWGVFIMAIQTGHAAEASLGYYIYPIMAVVLGFLIYQERFSGLQGVAIGLIVVAVLVLGLGLGKPPWIALILAASFSLYALIKKRLNAGPVVTVFVEVLLLAPLALFWLGGVHLQGWAPAGQVGAVFGSNWRDTLLLLATGPLTAGPLILFSYAVKRVPLSLVGLIQYINPSMQLAVAVGILAEPFTRWHSIALPIIWLALALYSVAAWRSEKSARSRANKSSTPSTTRSESTKL